MTIRRVAGVAVFFVVVAGVLATLFGRSLLFSGAGVQDSPTSLDQGNAIVRENGQENPTEELIRTSSLKASFCPIAINNEQDQLLPPRLGEGPSNQDKHIP